MKKFLSLAAAVALVASLSGCGGDVLVDLDTPKSQELSSQYEFYPDSMNTIRADMQITPEQADEVFIVLVGCGLNEKIASISESNGVYSVNFGGRFSRRYVDERRCRYRLFWPRYGLSRILKA